MAVKQGNADWGSDTLREFFIQKPIVDMLFAGDKNYCTKNRGKGTQKLRNMQVDEDRKMNRLEKLVKVAA